MQTRSKWSGILIDKQALMNMIWRNIPEYAVLANQWEQSGLNSIISAILPELGSNIDLTAQNDRMICMFPDAGEDYQMFKLAGHYRPQ